MIYLELFLTFMKIGLFTFGGGHAMIPMIMDEVTTKGWLELAELKQLIAVSESTPGPFAINIATFIGSGQGPISFLGAMCATIGVVTPSFIIILIIAALLKNFIKYKGVKKVMSTMKPVIIGLIIAAGISILLTNIFPDFPNFQTGFIFDYKQIVIFITLFAIKLVFNKRVGPIPLILLAALLGIGFYGV